MMTYYKATRPDGFDSTTGTVLYEVGKRVRPKPCDESPCLCGPGYLHAADVPAETLVVGSWPCRLFEVTGKPAVGFSDGHPHKGGFRQLVVVKELPAHLALGPNGLKVAALIERAKALTLTEVSALAAVTLKADWRQAAAARRQAAAHARWASRRAASTAASTSVLTAASGVSHAAFALCVQDLITPEQFDALYGPWHKVIEEGWRA